MSTAKLKRTRLLVSGLVVADLLALAALAVHSTTTVRTTTTAAAGAEAPLLPVAPAAPTAGPTSLAVAAPGAAAVDPVSVRTVKTAATAPTPSAASIPRTTSGPTVGLPPSDPPVGPCPLPLATPTDNGGLQSLITLAPAFGPYSAEAFAAASAYQPVLQLLGPVLAQYAALAPTIEPGLDPLLAQWERLLDAGFTATSPFYTPYRQQVLQAESRLAVVLAPFAQGLPSSALGGCLVAVESALLSATKG